MKKLSLLGGLPKQIFLNAGHYDNDPGVIFKGIVERDEAKKVRDLVSKYLKEAGFNVIEVPDNLNLRQSIDFVNLYDTNELSGLALDLHFNNAGSLTTNVRGVEIYSNDSLEARARAKVMSEVMANYMGIPNRGWKSQTVSVWGSLGWVSQVHCPADVVEILYLSHPEDRKLIEEKQHDKIAKGIVAGVMKLYGIEPKPSSVEANPIQSVDLILSLQTRILELTAIVVGLLKKISILKGLN